MMESPFALKGATMSKKKNKAKYAYNNEMLMAKNRFELRHVTALTPNQQRTFSSYQNKQNLMLHGYAGTGKTYISMYLALEEILGGSTIYDKIIIVRSVVPSRDVGFLPGNIKEKTRVYEEPYKEICDDLFGRGDAYDILKCRGAIQFTTTSFLRGLTFNNAIVIVVHDRDKSGLHHFINITKKMNRFDYIEFEKNDIVRSGIVKDYIIKRTEIGIST